MYRVLICGGRNFNDYEFLKKHVKLIVSRKKLLDETFNAPRDLVIIHGGARGADSLADDLANECGLQKEVYPANWEKYGKSAGYIRNQQMLNEGKPDLVIAFTGGVGTNMMCDIAQKSGIEVVRVK